jgi:uncharacterized protein (DUF362 family)
VVKVHMPGMRGNMFPHADAARVMVDRAVTTLTGLSDPGRAWQRFVRPDDRVGIKVNCLGTRLSSSMKEVAYAVAQAVRAIGVPDGNIAIFDQFPGNMMGGRYQAQKNPARLRVLINDDLGFESELKRTGAARARLAKTLTWATAIINLPPIKDHDLAGVTCAMKNMTFGTVEKPHVNHRVIHEAIPHLWALEEIRGRVRLNLVDGSFILYDGGPKHNPRAHAIHDSIYATTDPVAMDTIALELLDGLRRQNGLKTLAAVHRPATYLKLAQELGLGLAERDRIHLQTVELPRYTGPTT